MQPRVFEYQRKKKAHGQLPKYTYEEIGDHTLRVTRDNEGELFQYQFTRGHKFVTYKGIPVEMSSLNPKGGSFTASCDKGLALYRLTIGSTSFSQQDTHTNQLRSRV